MRGSRARLLTATAFIHSIGLLAGAAQAHQVAGTASVRPDATPSEEQEIVVTGSNLRMSEFNSPAPVQVIGSQDIEQRGLVDTASIVQTASVALGQFQQNTSLTGLGGLGIGGGNGTSSLSLRGLGGVRTLILLNGRRMSAAGAGGRLSQVDLNTLPAALIERVEILKDGASSVYGSDAVAGVVNIITRQRFDGLELQAYGNITQDGGGDQFRLSGVFGHRFANGYVTAAVEWYRQDSLLTQERDYTNCPSDFIFDPQTGARADVIEGRRGSPGFGQPKCYDNVYGAAQVTGITGVLQYDPTDALGTYGSYAANPFSGAGWRRVNVNGNPASFVLGNTWAPRQVRNASSIQGTDRLTGYLTAGFDLSERVEVFAELLGVRRVTDTATNFQFSPSIAATQTSNPFGRTASPLLIFPTDNRTEVNFIQAVAGLRGSFDLGGIDNIGWSLWGQYARSSATYRTPAILRDSVLYSDGNPANGECFTGGVTATPVGNRPCTPIDWFGPAKMSGPLPQFSDAERAFLFADTVGRTRYTQAIVEGSLNADIFDLPAGPVSTAVGFHWRRNTLNDQPDPQSQAQNLFAGSTRRTVGATEVKEAFAEVRVPIFADRPFARDLSINLAGRVTSQQPSGTDVTYRIGANWTITDEYRIRGTYGTSFRAPAVFERALGSSVLNYRQTIYPGFDPCINPSNSVAVANCLADGIPAGYTGTSPNGGTVSAVVTTGGNPDLGPERSTAWTVGAVWSPSFINFRAAVDYWHISLTDEISTLQGGAVGLCYNSPDFPDDPYCRLFTRDRNPASATFLNILTVNDNFLNLAERTKSGIDVTLHFHQDLGARTRLNIDSQLSWVLKSTSISGPGASARNVNNTVFNPGFGGLVNARIDHGPWSFAWNVQIIGEGSNIREAGNTDLGTNPHAIGQVRYRRSVDLVTYSDVSVRRQFDNFAIQIGVQNLFNRAPPPISSEYQYRRGESVLPFYDLLGRRMYLSASTRF